MIIETQAQAWVTPIGTEIPEDVGRNGKIVMTGTQLFNGVYHTSISVRCPDDSFYNPYIMNNFLYLPGVAASDLLSYISLRQTIRLVPIHTSEIDILNELWNTNFGHANKPHWLILHPNSPDSGVVLTYAPW